MYSHVSAERGERRPKAAAPAGRGFRRKREPRVACGRRKLVWTPCVETLFAGRVSYGVQGQSP